MEALNALIDSLRGLGPFIDPDGEEGSITVLKPVSAEVLTKFDAACGGKTPDALREFLQRSAGLRYRELDFEPEPIASSAFGFEKLLPASNNGCGDGFVIEVDEGRSRVWWLGHDSWFIVYWGELEEFLALLLERAHALAEGDDDELWKPSCFRPSAATTGDPVLEAFARDLPKGSLVRDLRGASPGTQIDYECREPRGPTLRQDLLFAFTPPPTQPRSELEWKSVDHYLGGALNESERSILLRLPEGCGVIHARDRPSGHRVDPFAYPGRDLTRRPPFLILLPGPGGPDLSGAPLDDDGAARLVKPWWRFWG